MQKSGWRWTTLAYQATQLISVSGLAASMFIMNRGDVSGRSCADYSTFLGISFFFVTAYADLLLTFRLYYMYNRSRRLLYISLTAYAAIVLVNAVLSFLRFPSPHEFMFAPGVGPCFIRLSWVLPSAFLLGLAYQIYLGVMALAKVRQAYAHYRILGARVSFLALLVKGNLLYYIVMVISYGLTTLLTFLGPPDQVGSYNLLTTAATGIFGPKLFRDMRRMLTYSEDDPTFGTIHFATQVSC